LANYKASFEAILKKVGAKEKVEKTGLVLLKQNLPNSWNAYIEGNLELKIEKDFELFLFAIAEHTKENVEELSVYRFYHLIDYIKAKNKKEKA